MGFCNREVSEMAYIRMIIGVLIAIGVLAGIPAGVQAQSDEGLVAEWHFDEGEGDVLEDSSGNGNDGVIYGATWVDGKYGGALRFDGRENYVKIPYDSSFDVHGVPFTVISWIKLSDATLQNQMLFCQDDWGWGMHWNFRGNRAIRASTNIGNSIPYLDYSWAADTRWHQIGQSYDGTNLYIILDGQIVKNGITTTATNRPWSADNFLIGSMTGDYFFNGLIDELRIYNRALTAYEIKSHYEGGQTALSITKTATPNSIKQGQTTIITLTVKNTGSTEISDIEIADTIPSYLTFIDGETSKRYDSLAPKDTRQISYTLQFNDAGTFNLEPAIATYADDKGNYNTVKSKPESIEVIRSIIENFAQTPKPMNGNVQSASVHLHGEKTDVVMGEDILLKLATVNLITKPTMHVQVIITPPSGMSVTSSEFVQSGAGLFTASYEIEPGVGRDIEVRMRSNQIGDFVVNGRIVYYFGDDMEHAEDHTLTLPITVRAESDAGAGAERTTGTSESGGSSTPGFAAVAAIIGLLLAYVRRKA